MQPPVDNGKFATYSGIGYSFIDTEVKGQVIGAPNTEIYLAPYPRYQYLLLEGNWRHPEPGEDGYGAYHDTILPHIPDPKNPPPILKCETYAVGRYPSTDDGSDRPPQVNNNGRMRPIQPGDHIKLYGQYVIDYSHSMYGSLPSKSFTHFEDLIFEAQYAHAEIHPYDYRNVTLLPTDQSINFVSCEHYTIAVPIYPQRYTSTWPANKLSGKAKQLIEKYKQTTRTERFVIAPPGPKPGPQYTLLMGGAYQFDHWPVNVNYTSLGTDKGWVVEATLGGTDLNWPTICKLNECAYWYDTSRPPMR